MMVVDMIATRYKTARLIFVIDLEFGTMAHIIVYEASPIQGLNMKIILFDVLTFFHSFVTNFSASLIGCIIPFNMALLGPFRL